MVFNQNGNIKLIAREKYVEESHNEIPVIEKANLVNRLHHSKSNIADSAT